MNMEFERRLAIPAEVKEQYPLSGKLGKIVEELRYTKDEEEFENISRAQEITDKAFTHMLGFIKAGMTEREVMVELQRTQALLGSAKDSCAHRGRGAVHGKGRLRPRGVRSLPGGLRQRRKADPDFGFPEELA